MSWSASALSLFALLLGAVAQAHGDTPDIVREPKHKISNAHWEVVQLPGQPAPIAGVLDSTDKVLLSLGCSDSAYLVLGPLKSGQHLDKPKIDLVWDRSVEAEPLLKWFPSDGWLFGIAASDPGFASAIGHLTDHDVLAARIIARGSTEPLQYRFALAGAAIAVDYVMEACSRKSSAN